MIENDGDAQIFVRPRCSQCMTNLAKKRVDNGKTRYEKLCTTCKRGYSKSSSRLWTIHKKDYCENAECKAEIENPVQLTVDHIDGDKSNNDPSNLMTLCANCHALKTWKNRDFVVLALREHDKMVK